MNIYIIIMIIAIFFFLMGVGIGNIVGVCSEQKADKFKMYEPEKIKWEQISVGDFIKVPYEGYGVVICKNIRNLSGNAGTYKESCVDILTTDGRVIRGCCYAHYYRLGHYQTLKSVANHFLYKGDSLDEILLDLKISVHCCGE